jgi:signal transduction histidine kinase
LRILVADDDEITLEMMVSGLAVAGFEVEGVEDGDAAWERISGGGVDLLIADWVMPGLDGVSLCEKIRSSDLAGQIHVLLVTSRSEVQDAVYALDAGADDFLRKPVDPIELEARVRAVQRLRELQGRIAAQNLELRQGQELKKDWINMIVHDLRSPLAALTCQFDLAAENPGEGLGERLELMKGEVQRVSEMLEQMLIMAKSEAGKLNLAPLPTDLRSLAQAACTGMQAVAGARGQRIEIVAEGEDFRAEVDVSLVRRLIDNLISNAIKFGPEGGCIRLALTAAGEGVSLAVSDEGPGVPAKLRDRLFQKYQTGAPRAGEGSRHGLGLAFCKLAVETHGGTIAYRSLEPRGSCLEARLPRRAPRREPAPALEGEGETEAGAVPTTS